MNVKRNFLVTMILGGVIFLLPLVFITFVLGKAFQVMKVVAKPLDALIPLETVGSVALVNIIAIIAIVLSCFFAGLLARSAWGGWLSGAADEKLQILVPGYSVIRDKVRSATGGNEQQDTLQPVLVQFDDYAQIAFEIERAPDGLVTIFLPGAPDPWAGASVFVTPDRVSPIDTDVFAAVKTLKKMGRGSTAVVGDIRIKLPVPRPPTLTDTPSVR
jgi:uncharacterized membrane protein